MNLSPSVAKDLARFLLDFASPGINLKFSRRNTFPFGLCFICLAILAKSKWFIKITFFLKALERNVAEDFKLNLESTPCGLPLWDKITTLLLAFDTKRMLFNAALKRTLSAIFLSFISRLTRRR